MATEIKFRRGTTAQHATFTGALGEVTVDTDKKTLVVHDGVTAGGTPLVSPTSVIPSDSTVTTAKIVDGNVTGAKLSTTSDNTVADTDEVLYLTSSTLKRSTLTGLLSSVFNGTRSIASGIFDGATFALQNAGGFKLSNIITSLTANRNATWPNRDIDLAMGGWVELASVPTTSGGAIAISFPTDATEVDIDFYRVSFSGTGNGLIQMNVGGTAVTTGYDAGSAGLGGTAGINTGTITNGFPIYGNAAGNSYNGRVNLKKYVGTNEWIISGVMSVGVGTAISLQGSTSTLAGSANGVTITPSTAFDAGKVFLRYR